MSLGIEWISQEDLLRADYVLVGLTTAIFTVRVIVQFIRRRNVEWQDIWLYLSFATYLTFSILYVIITPIFFKLQKLQRGAISPWPTMRQDIKLASEVMWCSGILYWTCLWCVKYSLLALYKKLLVGMPKVYLWFWWGTLVFCIIAHITCIVTGPGLACDDTKKFFDEGVMCSSPKEVRQQTANLYYAYAVDVLTNLMVMFLPLRLIWSLQMERPKKIGCCLLFASGFIIIIFSTLRIVQVGGDSKPRSPDPKWLTMWTIIECTTAVIVGCCPVLASLFPKFGSSEASYDTNGFVRQNPSRPDTSATPNEATPRSSSGKLKSILSSKSRKTNTGNRSAGNRSLFEDDPQDLEELPKARNDGRGIRVTPQLQREHERRVAARVARAASTEAGA